MRIGHMQSLTELVALGQDGPKTFVNEPFEPQGLGDLSEVSITLLSLDPSSLQCMQEASLWKVMC